MNKQLIVDILIGISLSTLVLVFAVSVVIFSTYLDQPKPTFILKYNADGCYAEILTNGVQTWCAKHCTPEEATQELDCQ